MKLKIVITLCGLFISSIAFADAHFSFKICNYTNMSITLYSKTSGHFNGAKFQGTKYRSPGKHTYNAQECATFKWDVPDGHSADLYISKFPNDFAKNDTALISVHSKSNRLKFKHNGKINVHHDKSVTINKSTVELSGQNINDGVMITIHQNT